MAEIPLSWKLGIDQVSPKTTLPKGAVKDAINVDIDHAGGLEMRRGYTLVTAGVMHSLWTSEVRGESFAVIANKLHRVTMVDGWHAQDLNFTFSNDSPIWYEDLNGDVICGNTNQTLVIAPDLSVRHLGIETPAEPVAVANSYGGFTAGTYGVAASLMYGDEEGPLSSAHFVTLTEGQGMSLTFLPPPTETLATKRRIYRTDPNGEVLYRATDLPVGTTSYIMGVTTIGRQAKNQFLDRMLPGNFVRYWNGLLWMVRGAVAFHSEPLNYGVYDPRFNFVQFPHPIRMFEPVAGGIFVGTKEGIYFLAGSGPKEFAVKKLGGQPPIKGSATRIPVSLLGDDGETGEYAALWLSGNGFVVGLNDGRIVEKQRKRIKLDDTSGTSAVVVHDRQVTAVVS